MKHRTWNRVRAWAGGKFWLPCPVCSQMYGGHELRDIDGKPSRVPVGSGSGWTTFKGICPDCTRKGLGRDDTTLGITYQAEY